MEKPSGKVSDRAGISILALWVTIAGILCFLFIFFIWANELSEELNEIMCIILWAQCSAHSKWSRNVTGDY